MTNEELTAAFPECERIKRKQVAPFVEQVFNEVESWRQIGYKIKNLCQKLWPKPEGVKWEDPLRQEWNHYFYGDYETGQKDFGKWTELLENEYFACLIDKVFGKGTWERNPWVFAYEFELIK